MSPDDQNRIQQLFYEQRAQTLVNLVRAHKAESDARIFRALALTGWLIVIGLALRWGMSS